MTTKTVQDVERDELNLDPITHAPGSHPLGTGVGSAAAAEPTPVPSGCEPGACVIGSRFNSSRSTSCTVFVVIAHLVQNKYFSPRETEDYGYAPQSPIARTGEM